MEIRPLGEVEAAALGELTVAAYETVDRSVLSHEYVEALRDVPRRAASDLVLVALDDEGSLLGGVTYVADCSSPYAELLGSHEAGLRMLAVAPAARGRGVGEALVRACIERARADGRRALVLHSTPSMVTARRLYERCGFRRDPERDWQPVPEVALLGYLLELVS